MIPFDLALTDTGDLAINRPMVNDANSIARAIEQEVSWFLGTWLLDRTRGLDWWALFEEKITDEVLEFNRERIRDIARNIRGVAEVTSVTFEFDNDTRQVVFAVDFIADDADQTNVVLATPGYSETNWHPTAFLVETNLRPSIAG